MTYMFVGALTALQVLAWSGWFIVEIIIHCLNADYNQGSYLQTLTEQSMYVFMYHGVILAGTLAALHLAASVKTRASRFCSMVVQMFGWLAWFYELYFIIPTFKSVENSSNLFCGAEGTNPLGDGFLPHPVSICRTARAVAAFSVIMEFFQTIITFYAIANAFIAPQLEDGTRKEIIEEDDAEVATVVSANPAGYEHINRSVSLLSYMNLLFVFLSLTGYAILVFSFIEVVRYRGMVLVPPTNGLISETWNMLGDFMLSWNFRQLSLTLALALGASSYAAFRHNRGIQAGALFLTVMTTLQWWSFIIFSGRYLTQFRSDATEVAGGYIAKRAQEAMFAGMCIILAGETMRAPILLARYYSYVPVTRNNVIPTYIRGAFATASWVPTILFILVSTATFAWWVLEFVMQCFYGIWNDNNSGFPTQHVVSDTMFIWQTLFILAAFIPEFFSERTKTLASKQAALAVNVVVHCAWFLLMWPWTYATIHKTGLWLDGFNNYANGAFEGLDQTLGPNVRVRGFCDDVYGAAGCRIPQGAAILAVIIGAHYVFLALWQIARILSMLPTPGQVATVDGTVVDALPPTVGVQKSLGWMTWLMLIGLLIWSLTAIDVGSGYDGFIAWTFNQLPAITNVGQTSYVDVNGNNYSNTLLPSPIFAYTYSIAFNALVIIGFTAWAASEMASNPVVANWHAWRTMVTGLSGLLMTFFVPIIIIVCRYINWGLYPLGALGNAVAAGVIIMCIGEFFLYACALLAQRSPLIALPAAINNTTQPAGIKSEVPLQQVVVTDPSKAGVHQHGTHMQTGVPAAGVNQYHTQHTEPTVVTQNNPQMAHTREYSGNQVPPV